MMATCDYKIQSYVEGGLEANCYSISFPSFMVIVDPCVSYHTVKSKCQDFKEIKMVFITHGHFDHFLELQSYLDNTDALIYLHKNALEKLASPVKNCSKLCGYDLFFDLNTIKDRIKTVDNDFTFEGIEFACAYWPGHSNCCISLKYDEFMFVGDFIFKGSIGRTDLYSSDSVAMNLSLKRFKELKLGNFFICPGHGKTSEFAMEMKNNPYLLKI